MVDYFHKLSDYLPRPPVGGGILPYWLLFISVVSVFNSAQLYQKDLTLTRKVYENEADPAHGKPQVTNLSARTFGTWTLITSIVRLYGAYHLGNPQVYLLVQWTYVVAFWHFFSEWLVYGTCKFGKGIAGPAIVATTSLVWMYLQKPYYVGQLV